MCGIFGYVGAKHTAANSILVGLKLLEYRGYDSWGIAVKDHKQIKLERHVGKIGDAHTILPSSPMGIGHTRWATHGGVTVANAHPHTNRDKTIAVVHNGIIENFQELKQELQKKGHIFVSETDTEVVPFLIEEYLKNEGFSSAVRDTFKRIKGLNAIVAMYAPSQEIVVVRNGSPLVAGVAKDGLYIASDAIGIVKHTKKVLFLEDDQMVILGSELQLIQIKDGKRLKPSFTTIPWMFESAEKGDFPHFLLKEIHEQSAIIKNIAVTNRQQVRILANQIKKAYGTFMVGCGTASYAAMAGAYFFSRIAKRHINWSIGSEFNYLEDYLTKKTLLLPISQSGETIDVLQPVISAKKRGVKISAITNVLGSTLYRQADFSLLLGAGPEKAVVATKSFTAMLAVLLYTAYAIVGKGKTAENLLLQAANGVKQLMSENTTNEIKKLASLLSSHSHVYILGRGLSYAAALECALKIKETTYIHAEGFAGGELKHGVITLIEKGTPCIVIAPNDETFSEVISNAQEVKARGAYIIGIGPKENLVFDTHIKTMDAGDATIILQVVVAQLLAYYLAMKKGIKDPDKPRNLAKSVTVK